MKKILILFSFFSCLIINSVDLKLPDEKTLKERFNALHLETFVDRTNLMQKLANKNLRNELRYDWNESKDITLLGIILAVENALRIYFYHIDTLAFVPGFKRVLKGETLDQKNNIFQAILADFPEELAKLLELEKPRKKMELPPGSSFLNNSNGAENLSKDFEFEEDK